MTEPQDPLAEGAPARPAAFFDLDKTLIATSSAVAFAVPLRRHGLLTRRAMLRGAAAQLAYLVGPADARQSERMRTQLTRAVAGWDVEQLSAIVAESLQRTLDATVYAQAAGLIAAHHAAGRDVVVVSASSQEIVRPIAAVLGADAVVATRMTVVDGHYTGGIDDYVYGPSKAVAMARLATERGYDLTSSWAYSDSLTDAPMLDAVGHGVAVNPGRTMRRAAAEHGWDQVRFARPGAVGPLGLGPYAAVAAGAAGTALVAAALALRLARRRG